MAESIIKNNVKIKSVTITASTASTTGAFYFVLRKNATPLFCNIGRGLWAFHREVDTSDSTYNKWTFQMASGVSTLYGGATVDNVTVYYIEI